MSMSCGQSESPQRDLRSIANDVGNAVLNWMTRIGDRSQQAAAAREFQKLNALSDAELAKRNLSRDQLLDRCFGARLYV